ncbi:hypothetical protein LOK49_LG02G00918 [Camellia lanceoleosa]|uniref:Uncharacterized protein n=1 Tax=Camellia lanceoleosa TaxID=1840588 RepID=A0ACC0IM30_9ERIC|nr:hypothetical protein LOK49_LG02G00918 [Camellia lanceoleosa]
MDLCFYSHKLSCEVIVNGAPYWLLPTPSNHCICFTWFDVQNEAFVMLPGLDFSQFYIGTSVHWKLIDWKDNAAVVVTPDVHFHEDLGLDSLDNMQIVMALEEEFKLEIPNKEADKIDS